MLGDEIYNYVKGDQSSDALASTMKEYLLDFGFIMDEKEPDIVISVGEMERFYMRFIVIIIDWMKQHLLVYIQGI